MIASEGSLGTVQNLSVFSLPKAIKCREGDGYSQVQTAVIMITLSNTYDLLTDGSNACHSEIFDALVIHVSKPGIRMESVTVVEENKSCPEREKVIVIDTRKIGLMDGS